MSWLTSVLRGKMSASEVLARSVVYLKTKLGITVSDEKVDEAVKATDALTDQLEAILKAYLATQLPALPAAVASQAVTAALNTLDAAIAGAGAVVKSNN